MTTYGVTAQGFVPKTLSIISDEIGNDLKAAFGPETDISAETVFGQLIGIFAEREALLWDLAEAVFNSAYPDLAEGTALDNSVALTGHTRFPATYSRVLDVELTGTSGTVVPAGTIFSVAGSPDIIFLTENEVTLTGSGDTVDCIAPDTGPVNVNVGTLTQIDTPVSGLTAVTNPNASIPGRNIETDAELKIRRNASLQISNAGPTGAIRTAILRLNEDAGAIAIESVDVFENTGGTVDAEGRPAKCFEAVVYQAGGSTERDQEIAEAIFAAKPAGILAYGDVPMTVTDSYDREHTISFSRPEDVPIYLALFLTVSTSYPIDGDSRVAAAVFAWGSNLGLGADVVVYPMLIAQISSIPGIVDVEVRIGTEPLPTSDDNIEIGETQISAWDINEIIITHI